jgi:hypothetical protein
MENQSASPLAKYLRQPKLYISLPSGGKWYSKSNVDSAEDIEVFSMTANDEIALKTPDGLYNGTVVVNVIKNCIPKIKDPWMVPMVDFDYLLASIRLASYGENINTDAACPKCSNVDTYGVNIQGILQHIEKAEFRSEIRVDDFVFRIRPLYYKENIELSKTSMMVQRALNLQIPNITDDDEKQKQIELLFSTINDSTSNAVTSGVIEIVTPDGETEKNPVFIKEFILNSDPKFFNAIQDLYKENNRNLSLPKSEVECSECKNKYTITTNLDQSNFFGQG